MTDTNDSADASRRPEEETSDEPSRDDIEGTVPDEPDASLDDGTNGGGSADRTETSTASESDDGPDVPEDSERVDGSLESETDGDDSTALKEKSTASESDDGDDVSRGSESSTSDPSSGDDERWTLFDLRGLEPEARRRWRDRLFVVGGALLLFIPLLGAFGLWDPWETHYGEVARQITERNDWISTWWGSHWEDGHGQTEGSYFFSKPILLMWMMAIGLEIFGFSEWGIRLGVTLVATVGLATVYSFGRSVFGRRAGFLMAGVLGTSPFWFFLSRQAQTDMPFVGLMTVGLCFFMMAAFGEKRNRPPDKVTYGLTFGFFGTITIPQTWLVLVGLSRWRGPNNVVMDLITRPIQVPGLAAIPKLSKSWALLGGSILLITGATLVVAGLWYGRHETDRGRRIRRRLAAAGFGVVWLPLIALLFAILIGGTAPLRDLNGWFVWGPVQSAIYGSCLLGAVYLTIAYPVRERRDLYLMNFYVFVGLATLAKGLLGFLLPGCILFFYILLTREWRMLKRVKLGAGTLAFVATTFPWYAAMLIKHTQGFWQRFFVHDHFKRLASGVHQIDTGSFEHFMRWLGYGLFPWSAFVPAALARFFTGRGLSLDDDRSRATLMLLLWATIAFTLFTLSSTKFHHYIFPVVPPLALLVALTLDDALDRTLPEPWPLYLIGIAVFALLAWDLIHDPQLLKDIFTYKYERKWDDAWNPGFRFWLTIISIPGLVGIVWFMTRNRFIRRIALGSMFVCSLSLAVFGLDVYMPEISSTWSQKNVWDAYYSLCTRVEGPPGADEKKRFCKEEAIAYKLNWRGETYYTQNEVIPVRNDGDWDHFIKEQGNETFYGIMQRGRYHGGFKRSLPPRFRGKSCIVHKENIKFILVKVPCSKDDRDLWKRFDTPDE
jgi:4-amino-4-deoxy-L-arabinose transferase-like glycosyltransferase